MTLLERTTALKSRAEALEDLQARIDEAALLQRRLDETKSVAASLVEVSEKVMLLGQARLWLSPAPEVVRTASKQLDKIPRALRRLSEGGDADQGERLGATAIGSAGGCIVRPFETAGTLEVPC